jgi:hypothetical protein
MDIEQRTADGKPNGDWVLEGGMVVLEGGMVVPVHLLYPGGEHERFWRSRSARMAAGHCSHGGLGRWRGALIKT